MTDYKIGDNVILTERVFDEDSEEEYHDGDSFEGVVWGICYGVGCKVSVVTGDHPSPIVVEALEENFEDYVLTPGGDYTFQEEEKNILLDNDKKTNRIW